MRERELRRWERWTPLATKIQIDAERNLIAAIGAWGESSAERMDLPGDEWPRWGVRHRGTLDLIVPDEDGEPDQAALLVVKESDGVTRP